MELVKINKQNLSFVSEAQGLGSPLTSKETVWLRLPACSKGRVSVCSFQRFLGPSRDWSLGEW